MEWVLQGHISWGGGVAAPGRAFAQTWDSTRGRTMANPAAASCHCSKLALEYGWGYFMIAHNPPLVAWTPSWDDPVTRCPVKQLASQQMFLEGGKELLSRKVSRGWLGSKFIFCSSAEGVEIKSLVLPTIAPILLYQINQLGSWEEPETEEKQEERQRLQVFCEERGCSKAVKASPASAVAGRVEIPVLQLWGQGPAHPCLWDGIEAKF